jgi:hypothetical protein
MSAQKGDNDGKDKGFILSSYQAGTAGGDLMNSLLALFGGYGLKGGYLLFYSSGLTFRASEFFLSVFRNRYGHGKRLIALLTDEIVYRHTSSPLSCVVCGRSDVNL